MFPRQELSSTGVSVPVYLPLAASQPPPLYSTFPVQATVKRSIPPEASLHMGKRDEEMGERELGFGGAGAEGKWGSPRVVAGPNLAAGRGEEAAILVLV